MGDVKMSDQIDVDHEIKAYRDVYDEIDIEIEMKNELD